MSNDLPTYKITLLPGDTLWCSHATHVCDANGISQTVYTNTTIEFTDVNKYCHVYEFVASERQKRNAILGYSNVDVWVTSDPDYVLPSVQPNTFLVPHPSWSNVYMPKASQCKCSQVYAVTTEVVNFNEPWVAKQQPKTIKKDVTKVTKVFGTSNTQEVVYDEEQDKYILKTTEFQYPVMETVDVYDESGAIVFQQEVQKTVKTIETVDEPVVDSEGKVVVMEDVLNEDGSVVMEPKVLEKYFNGSVEVGRDEYLSLGDGGMKAVWVKGSLF